MSGDNRVHVDNPVGGTDGWGIINGPGSLLDRYFALKDLARITEMPKVSNIEIKGSK